MVKKCKNGQDLNGNVSHPNGHRRECKKVYQVRDSPLTELWKIKHIRTIYHIFLAMLIGLFINTAAYDYLNKGEVRLGVNLIVKGFAKFHLLFLLWAGIILTGFVVYFAGKLWATVRVNFYPQAPLIKVWDEAWIILTVVYYVGFMYKFTSLIIELGIPTAGSISLLSEIVRIVMKSHAFVRSNAPRVLQYKPHTENAVVYPDFKKFLYFSFAPTLVYQDDYPRSQSINWNYVLLCFVEVIGAIFYLSFLFERFLVGPFEDYGIKPYRWQDITVTVLGNAAAGMLIMLIVFYAVLHAWMNGFAEVLRFGDRMFYEDWWTSASYDRYYRTWNVIVHDWLHTYVYNDFYNHVSASKTAGKFVVFFISAIVHEYILAFTFRFWIPILFLQFFGAGVVLTFFNFRYNIVGNTLLWYFNALGMGINTCAFTIEFYSRINCPIADPTWTSYFVPRMLSCNKV